jgi:hypothetical protein
MGPSFARCVLALLLVFAFAFQQTGGARLGGDCCEDEGEADACTELGEPSDCPPSCADCVGCPGPGRVLMSSWAPDVLAPSSTLLAPSLAADAEGRDPRLRVERPPRA